MNNKELTNRMNDIAKKIKDKRIELGYSLQDVADLTGLSKSTLQRYETGFIKNIPMDKFEILAKALRTDPWELVEWDIPQTIMPVPSLKLPILGTISCGEPLRSEEDPEDWIDLNKDIDADFCLRANGDSMIGADIFPGDILFIKKMNGQRPKDGDIVVACIDGDTTLKSVFSYENTVILNPFNRKYDSIQINVSEESGTDLIIQGKLTYVLHKY